MKDYLKAVMVGALIFAAFTVGKCQGRRETVDKAGAMFEQMICVRRDHA